MVARTPEIKASIAERFNRTLKGKMFKYFTWKGSRKYIDVLQQLVDSYNSSVHRSIKIKPIDVSLWNQELAFSNLYHGKSLSSLYSRKLKQSLNIGDTVRLKYTLKPFDKGYYPNWTYEIFIVAEVIKGDHKFMYKIKDTEGKLDHRLLYDYDLQKIVESIYRIEKVYSNKKRKVQGVEQVYVKWLNFPASYNSWIPVISIVNI